MLGRRSINGAMRGAAVAHELARTSHAAIYIGSQFTYHGVDSALPDVYFPLDMLGRLVQTWRAHRE